MKKKMHAMLICVILLLCAGGWIWRYFSINAYYASLSDNTKAIYSAKEIIPFGTDYMSDSVCVDGYSIRVDGFEIVDFGAYVKTLELTQTFYRPDKLALVYITLFNENSSAEGVMLTELGLHGVDNYAGMDWDLLLALNPVLQGNFGIHLSPNTEYSLVLPFGLYKAYFGNSTWQNLEDYKFFLHITAYPTEKDIKVW